MDFPQYHKPTDTIEGFTNTKTSKVIEFFDMSCDCECCGTYTDYYVHLDCLHGQSVTEVCKVGEEIECDECNQTDDETF